MSSPNRTSEAAGDWLTAAEAAELAHASRSTLARAADAGKVIAHKTPGGQRRYLRSSILELIAPDKAAS